MVCAFVVLSSFVHVETVVGIDGEAQGDPGNSTRGRGNAGQLELVHQVVVTGTARSPS